MVTQMVKLDFISSSYRSCHVATSVPWKWREGNEASIICFLALCSALLCYLEKSLTSLRLVFLNIWNEGMMITSCLLRRISWDCVMYLVQYLMSGFILAFTQSDNHYLLIRVFGAFAFNVIVDMFMLNISSCCFHFFFVLFFFSAFFWIEYFLWLHFIPFVGLLVTALFYFSDYFRVIVCTSLTYLSTFK